jgi:hypothetical protein
MGNACWKGGEEMKKAVRGARILLASFLIAIVAFTVAPLPLYAQNVPTEGGMPADSSVTVQKEKTKKPQAKKEEVEEQSGPANAQIVPYNMQGGTLSSSYSTTSASPYPIAPPNIQAPAKPPLTEEQKKKIEEDAKRGKTIVGLGQIVNGHYKAIADIAQGKYVSGMSSLFLGTIGTTLGLGDKKVAAIGSAFGVADKAIGFGDKFYQRAKEAKSLADVVDEADNVASKVPAGWKIFGKTLGFVGGGLSIISGSIDVIKGWKLGDGFTLGSGALGIVGGVATIAALIVTSATAGVVLAGVGLVAAIGAAVLKTEWGKNAVRAIGKWSKSVALAVGKGVTKGYRFAKKWTGRAYHAIRRGVGTVARQIGRGAKRVYHAIRRGVGTVARQVGRGAKRAYHAIRRGIGTVTRQIGRGAKRVYHAIRRGVGTVARQVGRGAKRAYHTIRRGVGTVARTVRRSASHAYHAIRRGAGIAVRTISRGAKRAYHAVTRGVRSAASHVRSGAAAAYRSISRGASSLRKGASGLLKKTRSLFSW